MRTESFVNRGYRTGFLKVFLLNNLTVLQYNCRLSVPSIRVCYNLQRATYNYVTDVLHVFLGRDYVSGLCTLKPKILKTFIKKLAFSSPVVNIPRYFERALVLSSVN